MTPDDMAERLARALVPLAQCWEDKMADAPDLGIAECVLIVREIREARAALAAYRASRPINGGK